MIFCLNHIIFWQTLTIYFWSTEDKRGWGCGLKWTQGVIILIKFVLIFRGSDCNVNYSVWEVFPHIFLPKVALSSGFGDWVGWKLPSFQWVLIFTEKSILFPSKTSILSWVFPESEGFITVSFGVFWLKYLTINVRFKRILLLTEIYKNWG